MKRTDTVLATKTCGGISGLRYSLRESTAETFNIDEKRGKICVVKQLDYEKISKYQLTVAAHDQYGHVGYSLVNLYIDDVNDNSPYFSPSQYNASVQEDVAPGTVVAMLSAKDADQGAFGQAKFCYIDACIMFLIVNGAHDDFYIDSNTGYLYTKRILTRSRYEINIQAKDGGGLVSDEMAKIRVTVVSPRISVPQFTSLFYKFLISEDVLPGIAIGNVEAIGPYPIKYNIYSTDAHDLFSVEPHTGRILVARMLDGDKFRSVLLNIQAMMEGGGANYTQVIINMADVNDNDPVFAMERVEVNVPEDFQTYRPFFAVQATDADVGQNGEVTYFIVSCHPHCPISLRPLTGELTLTANLDFESVRNYEIVIRAKDKGVPPRSNDITVIVNVFDVNDNPPVFESQHYTLEVPEDMQLMTEVLTVKATDIDLGENGRIRYVLADDNSDFGIHASSGKIFLKNPLDREKQSFYNYTVMAIDFGQPHLSSNVTLDITVLDINDNSPKCVTSSTLTFNDNTEVGDVFGHVRAVDPDAGINGTVTYRLQNTDANFDVNNKGEVSIKRKVHQMESIKNYRLSVIASDSGVESRSSVCQVKIAFEHVRSKVFFHEPINRYIRIPDNCLRNCRILTLNASNVYRWDIEVNDISAFFQIEQNVLLTSNDFDPSYFEKNRHLTVTAYDVDGRKRSSTFFIRPILSALHSNKSTTTFIKINRSAPIGTKIGSIGREEKEVYWTLLNETSDFVLHEASSALYLSSNLMDNDENTFVLNVLRTAGPEYLSQKYVVLIEVVPENIHHPEFEQCPVVISVSEDIIVGSHITQINAFDYDEGPDGELFYRLLRDEDIFSIDSLTGDLFINQPLNRSVASTLLVTVEAEDQAVDYKRRKRSKCSVFIYVNDTNNNTPFFISDSQVYIGEDSCGAGVIHRVVAKDIDDGESKRITYSIIDAASKDLFALNETTGELSLKDCLAEKTVLRVRASDNGPKPNAVDQNITVNIINNKYFWKFFATKHYQFSLKMETKIGTVIHDFNFRGEDLKEVRLFQNSINSTDSFYIDKSGKLRVSSIISGFFYDLIAVVVNRKGQSDWTNIRIEIPKNFSNLPRIASSSCGNLTIRENVAISNLAQIFTISDHVDKSLRYKIVAGNERNLFTINSETGLVSCAAVDREYKSEYFLVIVVERQGILTEADTCTLRVRIIDENDNTPNITSVVPDHIKITDDSEIGSTVAKVFVVDDDEGENGQVYFNIIEDESGMFDIDPETGEIIFARDFPPKRNEFFLKVRAENRGYSLPLFGDVNIPISLKRKKHSGSLEPSFLRRKYTGYVFESVPKGEVVIQDFVNRSLRRKLQVQSTDRLNDESKLTYSIISGNIDNVFEIDNKGRILTKQELDREIQAEYNLKIVGHGDYRISPETSVYIRILNINDNVPLIKKMRPFRISENTLIGTAITKVVATDVDVDSYIEYSLTRNEFFDINRFTGVIHLKAKLDYEKTQRHELMVQAYDGEHSTTSSFIVNVIDENDNAPEFEKSFYDIIVEKDLSPNSVIAVITATDLDVGKYGKIFYNFSAVDDKFVIDKDKGIIQNTVTLSSLSTYYLKIQAFDSGSPPLSSATTLQIRVVNKSVSLTPSFTMENYRFHIVEDTEPYITFGKVQVNDASRNYITFQIVEKEVPFNVDSSGKLSLRKRLDREKQSKYQFKVEAFSKFSSRSATAVVDVFLIDKNDNAPKFGQHPRKILVSENMKENEVLLRFEAFDLDENNKISYELIEGNDFDMFRLDRSNGLLYFMKWSEDALRERKKFADLVILATDNGNPSLWNVSSVSVAYDVDAWSGSAPFFIVPYYQKSVLENVGFGRSILQPKAVNRIGIYGNNWEYSIRDNDELFTCNSSTGEISITGKLDYETRTSYEFSLLVRDRRSRSAVVPIHINVLGVDEYAPEFTKKTFIFKIPNTALAGERVGIVAATDRDSGIDGIVRYHFEKSNVRYLSVDSETGQIFLREDVASLNNTVDELYVVASSGLLQSKAKIFIEIGDFPVLSATENADSLSSISVLSLLSVLLLLCLSLSVLFMVLKMRRHLNRQKQSPRQVYSVSRGNVAVMADIHRESPKFFYEKHRILLTGSSSANFHKNMLSEDSGCRNEPVRLRTRSVHEQLRQVFRKNVENALISRSMPRSVPDSGIEPDDVSEESSITDYLTQIGVTYNQVFDQSLDESNSCRIPSSTSSIPYDSELNELIYAKVDEILSPPSRVNSSLTSLSFNINSLDQSPFKMNPVPPLRPLTESISKNNSLI
uniref:Cadherin domain-containing protein n=1 Tax=Syphacia muris TaxID=451379 RepID=A0A0N5AIL5_9BILA